MKIFLDFDDVIFNAKKFKLDLIGVFLKNGISREEFDSSYYFITRKVIGRKDYYDPKKQILVLRRKESINQKKLKKDLDNFMEDLSCYVFKDFYAFLKLFRKSDLYLITFGHPKFQAKKINRSGIKKYFKKVIISRKDKVDDIMRIMKEDKFPDSEEVVFVEDYPEQVEEAKKRSKRIRCFHMCRPEGRYSNLACAYKDFEVKNLGETLKIVKKIAVENS
jgi:FMN phosphatase YigB (HAD superfamily)